MARVFKLILKNWQWNIRATQNDSEPEENALQLDLQHSLTLAYQKKTEQGIDYDG